ncbi:hypothetical protein Tco_1536425, partial [Tanacetum coccineum]
PSISTARPSVCTARPVCTGRPSINTARPVSTARPSINTARLVSTTSPSISIARPGYASRPNYPRMDNVWRPKGNYLDHVSKDSGSFMLKKVEYIDPKGISKSVMAWISKRY